jgi:hypothetical protein
MTGRPDPRSNGSKPDLSRSRFFCNNARKGSLVCGILAFAALVIGGGFAEISSNGSPTTLETDAVRWVIVGSLVIGVILYVVGGRMLGATKPPGASGSPGRPEPPVGPGR